MSLFQDAKVKREEAGRLVTEARAILDAAKTAGREMTGDETQRFDALMDEADGKVATAERMERQASADKRGSDNLGGNGRRELETKDTEEPEGSTPRATRAYHDAFVAGLRGQAVPASARGALQVDVDTGGGILAASERFVAGILKNVDDLTTLRQMATVYTCGYNETLGVVTLAGDVGAFTFGAGELTEAEVDDNMKLGARELKPRQIRRKIIKVSKKLMESSRINIEQYVQMRVAYALASGLEAKYMTGSGAAEPLGVFTAADDGIPTSRDVATGSNTDFTGDGLITIQGTLKDQYQAQARWLLHRLGVVKIRKLKDGNGVYLWQPGLTAGQPNLILGKPYVTSEFAPSTYTANRYGLIYGDFSFYWIVDAISATVQRLVEQYATTGQIGLLFDNMAADGAPVLAEAFVRGKMSV